MMRINTAAWPRALRRESQTSNHDVCANRDICATRRGRTGEANGFAGRKRCNRAASGQRSRANLKTPPRGTTSWADPKTRARDTTNGANAVARGRNAASDKPDLFYQFGLPRDDYSPKPAFETYRRLIAQLGR
jgi:hypothetical protein